MAQTRDADRDSLIAEAAEWLARLDVGRATTAELDAWRNADPRRAAAFAEAAAAWNRIDILRAAPAASMPAPPPLISRRAWLTGAAAAVVASVGGLAYMRRDYLLRERIVTAVGERHALTLPDGSSMDLNTDTEIFWRFDREARRFWLQRGEAALIVAQDAARPFQLLVAAGLTELTAGRFNARIRPSGLELLVLAGRVTVRTATGRRDEVRVATPADARQVVTISERHVDVSLARDEAVQNVEAWRRGEIVFSGQTLNEAVAEYNRYLSRKLVVGDAKAGALRLGGRFLTGNPDAFLTALRTTFGVQVTEDGPSRILLNSR
jgi:transmembrane sensor